MASFNSNGGVGDVPYGPTTPPSAKVPGGIVPKQFTPTTPADRAKNPNRVASVIGKVGDYLGNVGRSVRDLPTAVGTAIETISPQTSPLVGGPKSIEYGLLPAKNLVTQVAQTVGAVAGRKDTDRSDQYSKGKTLTSPMSYGNRAAPFINPLLDKKPRSSKGIPRQGNPRGGSTVSEVK